MGSWRLIGIAAMNNGHKAFIVDPTGCKQSYWM